jgi:signal transduction histidine kinase
MPGPPAGDDEDSLRHDAIAAFAHEIRTPLTSLRMVIELGRRLGSGGSLAFDPELTAMLESSIGDLQRLADELQELSRLERGRLTPPAGWCSLAAAVSAATDALGRAGITLAGDCTGDAQVRWDRGLLAQTLAAFAGSANRLGDGSGEVRLTCELTEAGARLRFASGEPAANALPAGADAGFAFFRARHYVLALGGRVGWERSSGHALVDIALPCNRDYTR